MKKLFSFALMGLSLGSMAQKKGFELKGKVGSWNAPAKAYLYYTPSGSAVSILDSAAVTNGEFGFKGALDEPVVATLILDEAGIGLPGLTDANTDFTIFYLNNEEISISSKDSVKKAGVSGSAMNAEGARYYAFIQSDTREEMMGALTSYVEQHPSSWFSLLALSNLVYLKADAEKTAILYKKVSPELQVTQRGKATAKEIELLRASSIGAVAPLFTQPDTSGRRISLSDLKGKYVLIDFWASWCAPCRLENPNLVRIYKKYHPKGLEMLGVSLDGTAQRRSWLEAIQKDSLSWTQVSDGKGADNAAAKLYGIQSIPQNFLIDPGGKIIALSLRGEDLEKKMEEIYNK